MEILHGTWIPEYGKEFDNPGKFVLWIETSEENSSSKKGVHCRHISDSATLDSYLVSGLSLGKALVASIDPSVVAFHAILPSHQDAPLPSLEMAQLNGDYLPDDCNWQSWEIQGIAIQKPLVFLRELHLHLIIHQSEHQMSSDLKFWVQYAQHFSNLVHRHQFLPFMRCHQPDRRRKSTAEIHTCWLPAGELYESELLRFSAAMPNVCRMASNTGIRRTDAAQTKCFSAKDLLRHFSEHQMDSLVANVPITKQILNRFGNSWLEGSLGGNGKEAADGGDLTLERWKQWHSWHKGIAGRFSELPDSQHGSSILGIRLDQSNPLDEQEWHLSFFVTSSADLSLRIDLEDWWNYSDTERARRIKQFGQQFDRNLLVRLGQAARICPILWEGLETTYPTGVRVDMQTAYEFLKNDALVLESAGFKILLPNWWMPEGRRRAKIRINASGRSSSSSSAASNTGYFRLPELVNYTYELSIGGETVNEEEWQYLVNAKSPLVRFRGEWMELDAQQMSAMLDLWNERDGVDELHAVSDVLKQLAESNETAFEFKFDETLEKILTGLQQQCDIEELDEPAGFLGELRPYQKQGLSWLATQEELGLNPCLADDMGLGKTIQIIALLLFERERAKPSERNQFLPTLLIAPTSVLSNWQKEMEKFSPQLKSMIHHGSARERDSEAFCKTASANDVVITSFTIVRKDKDLLKKQKWRRIVVDEAQNIKNPKSSQSKSICGLDAPFRIALTGTPIENRLLDLWSLFRFLNPGYLGTAAQFRRAYEKPIFRNGDQTKAKQLQQLVRPFILRRMKTDQSIIDDLPEKLELKVYCNLTKEQASLYQALTEDVKKQIAESEGIQRKGLILSTLMKLKQICNHPAQFLQDGSDFSAMRSHKLTRLTEMIEEVLEASDSLLIFTQFTEIGGQLEDLLRTRNNCPVYYLHGGTSRKRREQMIESFQDPDSPPSIFILSLKAGGVGITLTRANHVFHFDRWWNPAVENQATDRAYRIGQQKMVIAHKMVTLGTLEERIDKMIEDKQALAESIVGSDESWLTELDDAAFEQLIALNRSAIMEA